MRLVIWNCRYGLTGPRAAKLAELRPDIAVVPEAEQTLTWPLDAGDAPSTYHWIGDLPTKGLGVASFGDWKLAPTDSVPSQPWVLPLDVEGPDAAYRLVAVWTIERPGSPDYAEQVTRIIDAFRDDLAEGTTVLAGDLNCSGNTADPRAHLANVALLRDLGLESAFHSKHGVEPGDEPMGTLYWRWQEAAPYHCDLGFVPAAWVPHIRSVEVGSFAEWVGSGISDHAPVVIDIDVPGTSALAEGSR